MIALRALPALLLAGCVLALAACSTPPPPRVVARPAAKLNTALLITSDDGKLTAEQLQAKHDEVLRYVTERGLLTADDVLVTNAAAADRIIRVSITESGGFKVTIFNPGSTGTYYSAAPRVSTDVRIVSGWPDYDPWFDRGYYYSPYPAPGYYPYHPRDNLRPHYPRDYTPPVEPSHPTPPVNDTPTPRPPPLPRNHGDHPRPPARDHDGRPDNHDRGAHPPRPHHPPPAAMPPDRSEPRQPPPEPRPPRDRKASDDDRRDYPQPAK